MNTLQEWQQEADRINEGLESTEANVRLAVVPLVAYRLVPVASDKLEDFIALSDEQKRVYRESFIANQSNPDAPLPDVPRV